jgi:hypothetical protein
MGSLPDILTINITQRDMDNGIPAQGDRCPTVLSVRRKLKIFNIKDIFVSHPTTIVKYEDGEETKIRIYNNPQELQNWLKEYDKLDHLGYYSEASIVKPSTFTLKKMWES